MLRQFLLLLPFALLALPALGQRTFSQNLYSSKPDHESSDPNDTAKITVYLPSDDKATGRCIVVCPGGGYQNLAWKKEGTDWGEWFQSKGIAAVVLKYRMPHGDPDVPISDAEEAMKLVRSMASSWHVKSDQVGIMGFSAGGHLASTIATQSSGEAKANFQILFYPVITMMDGYGHKGSHDNFLGDRASKKDEKKYSSDLHVTRITPRAFIALADDDQTVPPANGVNYYLELYRHDVPASLHVWPNGGHGFGSRMTFNFHTELLEELSGWLKSF